MAEETASLQQTWRDKGDSPCLHPVVDREYYVSAADGESVYTTGDWVCTTCGECFYVRHTVEDDRIKQRARLAELD